MSNTKFSDEKGPYVLYTRGPAKSRAKF